MRTRFPARAAGPADRLAGFVAHLRLNGIAAGPAETAAAMQALLAVDAADPNQARLALKTLFARGPEGWQRFDDVFDAYWSAKGAERPAAASTPRAVPRPALWARHLGEPEGGREESGSTPCAADADDGEAEGADGRRLAARAASRGQRRLDPAAMDEAERAAERLARALRDQRSRRRRRARRGILDLRRVARASLARGGEPLDLYHRKRRDRPARLVAILDVSGSMEAYARLFLAFLKGLAGADEATAAFLFHTRLLRVCAALREPDALKAAARLSLLAEGFGGGTRIADCLAAFNTGFAKGLVTRRTVVLILSDGFDGCAPERLAAELARLRRRAGRVFWLDPQAQTEPPAALAAALHHLDARLPAGDVTALAALVRRLERL